jgi:hypothetical protein
MNIVDITIVGIVIIITTTARIAVQFNKHISIRPAIIIMVMVINIIIQRVISIMKGIAMIIIIVKAIIMIIITNSKTTFLIWRLLFVHV